MSEKSSEPTVAVRTAKRAFWLAVIGGWIDLMVRWELFNPRLGGLLILLAVACLLSAAAFGLLAFIRSRAGDRSSVMIPALAGLLLGFAVLANLGYWARDQWVKARIQAMQGSPSQPAQTEPAPVDPRLAEAKMVKASVKYEFPLLTDIPEVTSQINAQAAKKTGEDAAVLRAWATHLEDFYAAYTNTFAASNKLHQVDLLDPKVVSNFNNDEGVRRRGVANQYADAWHKVAEALWTFEGKYYNDLMNQKVSSERMNVEGQALGTLLKDPEVAARIASLAKLCKAEEAVGRNYNYAVSTVFDYALISSKVPTAPPSFKQNMEQNIAKLREAEQAASDSRREVFMAAVQKL